MKNNFNCYRLSFVLFILISLMVTSGCWTKTYEKNGWITSVTQSNDGGYIASGAIFLDVEDTPFPYIIKTNSSGKLQWQILKSANFGIPENTSDNGFVLPGVKLDSNGNVQWYVDCQGVQNGCPYYYMFQLSDGNYSILGKKDQGTKSILLIRTNENGIIDHENVIDLSQDYDIPPYDGLFWVYRPNFVSKANDEGLIFLAGNNNVSPHEYLLIKTDKEGLIEWESKIIGENESFLDCVYINQIPDKDDFAVLLTQVGPQNYVTSLYRADKSGNLFKLTDYSMNSSNIIGYSVSQLKDGGYIIAGSLGNPFVDFTKGTLVKVDQTGKELWRRSTVLNSGLAYSVAETKDEGFIVGGFLDNKNYNINTWLSKTDSNGFALPTIF
jgi:hypothetical protein